MTDQQLLRDYAANRTETAFAELVRRHVDLVYSAALRLVRDAHLAEDVTQSTFIALAQNAGQLTERAVLAGWLHRTTQNLAANVVRAEVRRRAREQESVAMNELLEPNAIWENIAPQLDVALGELSEPDRDALLLRYFQKQSARDMAQTLGVSEDAAQKRVNRAVDRLRENFAQRGFVVGAGGLGIVITANAVQAAPIGLTASISSAVALAEAAVQTSTLITATKTLVMTTLQKVLITTTVVVLAGAGIFETRQAARLNNQAQLLQQQQAPLTKQLAQLKMNNESLSNRLAEIGEAKKLSEAQFRELLKLRGQTGQAQTAMQELTKLRNSAAQQNTAMPAYMTNAMAMGMSMVDKFAKKAAGEKIARMKEKLHLTDDQAQAITDLMNKNIETSRQRVLSVMQGKPQDPTTVGNPAPDEDAEIKALLTPDQLAAYPDFKQTETLATADNSAKSSMNLMANEIDLSPAQQDQVHAALYQFNLNKAAVPVDQAAIAQARASGDYETAINLLIENRKQNLANELKALDGILTPDQLNTYKQKQMDMIEMQTSAMKMFLPKPATAAAP